MNKIFSKKCLAVLLTVLMLFSMVPAFSMTASAGSHTPVEGVTVSVSNATSENLSSGTLTVTAKGGLFSKKTATVTVSNSTDSTAQLTFTYSASSANSFTVAGASASTSGSYSALMAAGGSVVIAITSNSGFSNTTATLTLSGFSLVTAKEASNVTFNYDSAYGGVTVDGEAVANGDVKEIAMSGAALVATATNGGSFLGWVDGTGLILSTATSYTLEPADDMTVKAVFVGTDSAPHFAVGSASQKSQSAGLLGMSKLYYYQVGAAYIFDDLNTAATYAASNTTNTLVLLNDATLPAGDYTIPSGVTLLIPFDSANTMYTTEAVSVYSTDSTDVYTTPTPYRTLTLADGVNITVNGAISLSAKHRAAQGSRANGGSPMGPVSFVNMQGSSKITVASGGTLYAYGYITGEGSVEVLNGGNVYEYFQFMDFRGGTQSTDMDNGVFPLSQYYVQNIEVPLTLNYGAKEYAYTTIYMSSADFGSSVAFIGPSSAMFNLTSGSVTKWYDGTTDRIHITLDGEMTVSAIDMKVGTSSINSANYELPINSNYTVTVESGSITINQDVALLPGAEIIVNQGATAVLGSGKNIYIYDLDEWGDYTFGHASVNSPIKPITYAPGRTYTRTAADLKDAKIEVYGTVDSSLGYVYTTAGGANIIGGEGGVANIGSIGSETVTYQMLQGGTHLDGTAISATEYVSIAITPAKLQNEDGSYVETRYTSGTYTFTDGAWNKTTCNHAYSETINKYAVCGVEGLKTLTCLDTVNCGYSYTEVIPALEHEEVIDAAVAPTCTESGLTEGKHCNLCGEILVAQETVEATGHSYAAVVTDPTCTEAGYTTYTCASCGDSYVEAGEDALGHLAGDPVEENRVEATCVTPGSYEMATYCSRCNTELSRETFSLVATGHTEGEAVVENEVAAGCLTEGTYDSVVYCATCGEELSRETIIASDALGHSYESVVTAPNCTEAGYTTYTCAGCGDSYVEEGEEALGHTAGAEVVENIVDATCTAEGSYDMAAYCTVCGAEVSRRTIQIAITSHTAGETKVENIVEATCLAEGSYDNVVYCSICNAEMSRTTIPLAKTECKAADAVVENLVDATCTENGSYDNVTYCSVCGEELGRETITIPMLSHSYSSVVTAPTCETDGYTTYSCSTCGDSYVSDYVGALGHDYTSEITKEATCTEKGEIVYTCQNDASHTYTEEIATISHTAGAEVVENIVESTCTTEGSYDMVAYCTVCGEEVSRRTVAMAIGSHTAGAEVVENIVDSTCTAEGSYDMVAYCTVCSAEVSRRTIAMALGSHTAGETVVENIVEATCSTEGSYDNVVYCSICNAEMSRTTIPLAKTDCTAGAAVVENIVEATCTENGSYDNVTYCSVCGEELERVTIVIPMLSHNYSSVVTAPTCEADGYTTYSCSTCGDSYVSDYVSALGHNYTSEITKEATCTEKGEIVYTCQNDASHTYTEEIATISHTAGAEVVENIVESTCTAEGSYDMVAYCTVCGEELSRRTISTAIGSHTAGAEVVENIVDSTCTTEGSYDMAAYCTVCGAEVSRRTIQTAIANHTAGTTVVENIVDSTCATEGSYDNVTYCSVCGEEMSRVSVAISLKGHTEVTDAAVEPTYDSTGLTEGSHCSVCGEVIVAQETIPALEYILGDADHNDEINILDLIALKKALLDEEEYTVVVDMDKNATVDSLDLVALKVYLWDNF